jgi:hypothetical protein
MLTEIVDRGILCEITRLEHVLSVGYSTVMTKAKFIKCLRHMVDLLCSLSRVNREMHRFATSSRHCETVADRLRRAARGDR